MGKRVMSPENYAANQAKRKREKVGPPGAYLGLEALNNPATMEMLKNMKSPAPRSKHGNIRTVRHGITFDSKHEADVYDELSLLQLGGFVRNLQRQVSFPLEVKGKIIQRWRCDFVYWETENPNSADAVYTWRVADAKSEHTANLSAWKRTRALFESLYGITVTIL